MSKFLRVIAVLTLFDNILHFVFISLFVSLFCDRQKSKSSVVGDNYFQLKSASIVNSDLNENVYTVYIDRRRCMI